MSTLSSLQLDVGKSQTGEMSLNLEQVVSVRSFPVITLVQTEMFIFQGKEHVPLDVCKDWTCAGYGQPQSSNSCAESNL
jgi:hypothetical protein